MDCAVPVRVLEPTELRSFFDFAIGEPFVEISLRRKPQSHPGAPRALDFGERRKALVGDLVARQNRTSGKRERLRAGDELYAPSPGRCGSGRANGRELSATSAASCPSVQMPFPPRFSVVSGGVRLFWRSSALARALVSGKRTHSS